MIPSQFVAKLIMPGPIGDAGACLSDDERFKAVRINGAIVGWRVAGGGRAGRILYFCGNGECAADGADRSRILPELSNWEICLAEYRGYLDPELPRASSERELVNDAVGLFDQLDDGRPVVAWGRSLGGAVAAQLATQRPVDGLVLESTFRSLAQVAAFLTRLPVLVMKQALRLYPLDTQRALSRIACPVLVAHSKGDELIPVEHAEQLLESCIGPRRYCPLRGGHDCSKLGQMRYRKALAELCQAARKFHEIRQLMEGRPQTRRAAESRPPRSIIHGR